MDRDVVRNEISSVFENEGWGFPGGSVIKRKKKKICLSVQETQVRSLVQEDPTCHRATIPCSTEPVL